MGKTVKRVYICMMTLLLIWCGGVLSDKRMLNEGLIRLHVVANSDTEEDQNIKLQVRDAVIESIQSELQNLSDIDAARDYLQKNLPRIQETANDVLKKAGVDTEAVATFCQESFDIRRYDTFALPAGVYESLRIVIGKGEGHNWWCVAFPALCVPGTKDTFEEEAIEAGFSNSLCAALTEEDQELRFFLLDKLGELENILFEGGIMPCSLD